VSQVRIGIIHQQIDAVGDTEFRLGTAKLGVVQCYLPFWAVRRWSGKIMMVCGHGHSVEGSAGHDRIVDGQKGDILWETPDGQMFSQTTAARTARQQIHPHSSPAKASDELSEKRIVGIHHPVDIEPDGSDRLHG
jgi:hypothetical protein